MQSADVYLMYCALKAHFKGDYDYHKFSGQTKVKRDSFWKRKDRVFFVKIGRKYNDGEILNSDKITGSSYLPPLVVNNTVYILNDNGDLSAYN